MSTYIRAEALLDLADMLDAEAREYAIEADPLPLGDPRRHALLGGDGDRRADVVTAESRPVDVPRASAGLSQLSR